MRWQKNQLRGSRPEELAHPRASLHTAASYYAKYMQGAGGNASLNRVHRLARLQRRDARIAAAEAVVQAELTVVEETQADA